MQAKTAQETSQPLFGVPIPRNADFEDPLRVDDMIVRVASCPAQLGEVYVARAILVEPLNLAPDAAKVVSAYLCATPLEGLIAVKAVEPGDIRAALCHFEGHLIVLLLEPHTGLRLVGTYYTERVPQV